MRRALPCVACLVLIGCTSLGGRFGSPALQPITLAGLRTDCVTAAVVGLRWDPPTGNVKVARYEIVRNGVLLGSTIETSFADTTVSESTHYSYSVSAVPANALHANASPTSALPVNAAPGAVPATGEVSAGAASEVNTPPASPNGDAPYCRSSHVESMSWDWAGGYTEPNGSDLWPVTWGRDGNVYTFFGDGGGFGGDNDRGRTSFGIAAITAPPPLTSDTVRNVYGGLNASHPSKLGGKAGSIIAVGSDFYAIGGVYNEAEAGGDVTGKSGAPKRLQLAYSKHNAHSWQAASWTFCSADDRNTPPSFCPVGFVNYGRGNAGAPDGHVYLLGFANAAERWGDDGPEAAAERQRSAQPGAASERPEAATAGEPATAPAGATGGAPATANSGSATGPTTTSNSGASTYLARVPRWHVLERNAYRYFAGLDGRGRPIWNADQRKMQPIFTDRNPPRPGCNGLCNMASPLEDAVYDPGIRRYIATAQGQYVGQTSFYDAPHPWGPWTTVSYDNIDPASGTGGWANLGTAGGESLGVHVVTAWISPDGLNLWLTYSSDGKAPPGALFPPAGTMLDSFNLVRARLTPGRLLLR